jgi:uncharacterized protein with HEPN domain
MARKVSPSIYDILENIDCVHAEMAGVSFAEFEANWRLRLAVQRAVEIISEATRRIPEDLKKLRPEIHWRRAAGIGNVLRHEYESISNKVIWDVVHHELPALKTAVEAIAKTIDE